MKILQVPSMPVILAGANNHGHAVICVVSFFRCKIFSFAIFAQPIEIDLS
jgi:hypothetical protein